MYKRLHMLINMLINAVYTLIIAHSARFRL